MKQCSTAIPSDLSRFTASGERALAATFWNWSQHALASSPLLVAEVTATKAKRAIRDTLLDHKKYVVEHGEDHPPVLGWKRVEKGPVVRGSSTEADIV